MEAAIIAKLEEQNKPQKEEVTVTIELMHKDADNGVFIRSYIEALDCGFYLHKHKGNYYMYKCERSRKPRGRSTGLPSKTTANSCSAYVSFVFKLEGSYKGLNNLPIFEKPLKS